MERKELLRDSSWDMDEEAMMEVADHSKKLWLHSVSPCLNRLEYHGVVSG